MPLQEKDLQYTALGNVAVPLPQHEDANGNMGVTGDNNPLPTKEVESDVMKPVDIQARLQKTNPMHAGVVVAPNTWSYTNYIDLDGFDRVGITCTKGAFSGQLDILWSNDNSSTHYDEIIVASTTGISTGGEVPTKARYAKVGFKNNDASNPQTVSTWLYPKA